MWQVSMVWALYFILGFTPVIAQQKDAVLPEKSTVPKVHDAYLKTIRPILRQKCFDCHSTETRYPWYHSIIGIRQLIDNDIEDARGNLEMPDSPKPNVQIFSRTDLKKLKKVIVRNAMPLWRYRLLHWDSSLTESEKTTLLNWIEESVTSLDSQEK